MSVCVVTGAGRGMGRACVERLRGSAQHLVAVDLVAPDLPGAIGVACDISDAAAVDDLVGQVRALGAFRSLAHVAGISPTMADPRRIFEVDLVGTQLLLDGFEELVEPGSAAVCWASSAAHQIPDPSDPELDRLVEDPRAVDFLDQVAACIADSGMAYSWAKRGVIRAAGRASVSWGRRGGRVNSISPGIIDTPQSTLELAMHPMMQTMLSHTPLGRFGRADEVAALAAFLLSEQASFVSGVDVLADGGMVQGMRAGAHGERPSEPMN